MEKLLSYIKKIIPKKVFKTLQPAYHFLLSWSAALIYQWPSEKLIVIGVTGTTGKTTSAYLIAKMLQGAGYKTGLTSTAIFNDGNKEWLNEKKMTMPGRFFAQRMLRSMLRNGCRFAVVETTSEGIRQFRHRFINYDILIFTGLYPEHIESHGGFENYKKAKGELFAHLKRCKTKYVNEEKIVCSTATDLKKIDLNRVKKTIIANLDDESAEYFLNFWAEKKVGYTNSDLENKLAAELANEIEIVKYGSVEVSSSSTFFKVEEVEVRLHLLGAFNAVNAMNAVCAGLSQNLSLEIIAENLEQIQGVAGRLEKIEAGQNFTVIIDYAFEPNAVAKLYETVNLMPYNKIIHVLGSAGGGRDISRRPKLGKLAGELADIVVITNEDPYDDDPEIIIDQVATGAQHVGKILNKNLYKILDRREAILKALSLAQESDIILITGKGSEQAICVKNGEKIYWDDRVVTREILGQLQN